MLVDQEATPQARAQVAPRQVPRQQGARRAKDERGHRGQGGAHEAIQVLATDAIIDDRAGVRPREGWRSSRLFAVSLARKSERAMASDV